MNQFIKEVATPYWWLSVIVVGLVIHVVGTIITKRVEVGGGRISDLWLKRTTKQKALRKMLVDDILADPHQELLLSMSATRDLLRSLFCFVFVIVGVSLLPQHISNIASVVTAFLALGFCALSVGFYNWSQKSQDVLYDLRNERLNRQRAKFAAAADDAKQQ